MNRWFWPRGRMYRNGLAAVGYFAEIDSVASVWRPEISARGTPAREVRRLEDTSMVNGFSAETQVQIPSFT
jgi:hypothetical protein